MFFKDTFFYKRINRQKRCNKADTIYKIHKSNIAIKIKQQKQKKRSPSGRFLCSAGLFQSLEKSSVPQTTCHQKKEQLRKRAALFLLSAFPVSTRSLPAFVGATASATQTRKKNAGQCLRPPPLIFSAVALSPSHRGLLRYRFAFE